MLVNWKSGELAYFFTPGSGPVPCRILGRTERETYPGVVKTVIMVRTTAARPGYKRGTVLAVGLSKGDTSTRLFTRAMMRVRCGKYRPRVHSHGLYDLPEYSPENFPGSYVRVNASDVR